MSLSLDALAQVVKRVATQQGVDYADARFANDDREVIRVRDAQVEQAVTWNSSGLGVRVLYRGAWGFAAAPLAHRAAAPVAKASGETDVSDSLAIAEKVAHRALEVARASAATNRQRVVLAPEEPQRGSYQTPLSQDPFEVPLQRKLEDLLRPITRLHGRKDVSSVFGHMSFHRTNSRLVTSEGTRVEQTLVRGSSGIKLVVVRDGEVQQRSYPMDHDGGTASKGYELIGELDFDSHVERLYDEAQLLLVAPSLPSGHATLILEPTQLALQIHESCGHPTEADRALGDEVSLAGASFLTPDLRGKAQYGSSIVNLTADATTPCGLGTFGWDDEGVPARRTPLVEAGRFVGYLSSRETAATLGLGRSAGCMRAESWARVPIIRMINVSLEPGSGSYQDLLDSTDDGVLMACNKSWSIDDLRLNFQFSCEIAWEIKGGKRRRAFRNPIYSGRTPEFWGSCDQIAGREAWQLYGFLHCGKGDPMQLMHVGHGCAPARFRDVKMGSSR